MSGHGVGGVYGGGGGGLGLLYMQFVFNTSHPSHPAHPVGNKLHVVLLPAAGGHCCSRFCVMVCDVCDEEGGATMVGVAAGGGIIPAFLDRSFCAIRSTLSEICPLSISMQHFFNCKQEE